MKNKVDQYGNGFKILGEYQGWHYGIWERCLPSEFVFLKAINEKDFVFCSMLSDNSNQFCGVLKVKWTKCMDGKIQSINEQEAKMLLEAKLDQYEHIPEVHIGDIILIKERNTNEFIKSCIKEINHMPTAIQIGYENNHRRGYVAMDEYEETWLLPGKDAYIRDSHYRKEFLQTKKHEWTICAYCGLPKRTKNITVDHIIPVDKVKKSQYAKWLLKIFHIDNVNDKKNLAGACRKCNSKKGTKMGLWVLRGFIGKSSVVWIVRWILRLVIFLLCVMAACNIGICHAAAGEMEESDVLNSNEPIIEESVIEKVPIIDSGVTVEANVLENTIVQNIGGVDEQLIEEFTNFYMLIPENVRRSFQDNGWSIYATTENIGQKYYGRNQVMHKRIN